MHKQNPEVKKYNVTESLSKISDTFLDKNAQESTVSRLKLMYDLGFYRDEAFDYVGMLKFAGIVTLEVAEALAMIIALPAVPAAAVTVGISTATAYVAFTVGAIGVAVGKEYLYSEWITQHITPNTELNVLKIWENVYVTSFNNSIAENGS